MTKYLLAAASVLALAACEPKETPSEPTTTSEAATPATETSKPERKIETAMSSDFGAFGLDLTSVKDDVHPGDNFYQHVNGKWLDSFVIPEEFSSYGSFTVLFERSEERVKKIIENAASGNASAGSLEEKIGAYYATFLDTDGIDAKGFGIAE